jgi:hypothetical protein
LDGLPLNPTFSFTRESRPRARPVLKLVRHTSSPQARSSLKDFPSQIPLSKSNSISVTNRHLFNLYNRIKSTKMAGKRMFQFGGLAAVGGGAYYLYSAGGDPKLAQKKIERT